MTETPMPMPAVSANADDTGAVRVFRIIGLALLLLLVALQFTRVGVAFGKSAAGGKEPLLFLTVTDILALAGGALLVVWVAMTRQWRAFRLVPLAGVLVAFSMVLSLAPVLKGPLAREFDVKVYPLRGVKEAVQVVEYLVVVVAFVAFVMQDRRALRYAMPVLFASVTVLLALAVWEYLRPAVLPMDVDGGFGHRGNRNVFAAHLCIALPLLLGIGLRAPNRLWLVWAIALAVVGVLVTLAGGLLLAMCLGLLAVCLIHRCWLLPVAGAVLIALLAFVVPHLPRANGDLLAESLGVYRATDKAGSFYADIAKVRAQQRTNPQALFGLGTQLAEDKMSWAWQQRYKDWQVELGIMRMFPLTGIGAGGHEANFNQFYEIEGVPKYSEDLMEKDSHSLYMVYGATAGVPAVLLLLWLLAGRLRMALKAAASGGRGLWQGVALGGAGSMVAVLVGGMFNEFLTRGVGISLGIALGMITAARLALKNDPEGKGDACDAE